MATGSLRKLGTFYLGGVKQARPTRPWRTDITPTGAPSTGNVPSYSPSQSIEIRNSDVDDAYKIQWIEVNENNKQYLVADRNLLINVSWDDLNAQGLINGKEVWVDGQKCLLRILNCGGNYRITTDAFAGGTLPNEWDRWIVNEGNISGLPVPTGSDLVPAMGEVARTGAHNQMWNWYYLHSWGRESVIATEASARGYNAARYFYTFGKHNRLTHLGWRPVLEITNSSPVISGDALNQGNKPVPFSVNYQVTDVNNDVVNVIEKINGITIRTLNNVTLGATQTITITNEQWGNIPYQVTSTITVIATDDKGLSSTREFTFIKANTAPTVSVVEPKGNLSNLAILSTLSPVFVWTFSDADVGDVQSAYQILIYDTNNQLVHDSSKKTGTASYYTVPENVLQWGVRYKWQVRVFDRYDVASEYSFQEFFLPNRAPMATDLSPGSNDVENPAGTGVSPEFTWTFTDLDLEAQASYQLKIYKTADNSLVYNSNRIYQNVQRHQIPAGALESGEAYYAILDVWDPNGLTAQTSKAYFQTNATPSAPILTLPVDNYRVSAKPTLQAIVGKDPEGDKQHFVIQIAKDALFTQDLLEFASNVNRTGWKVGGVDIPQTGVSNSAEGQTVAYTLQVNLNKWTTMFWRIAAIDATTNARGVWSNSRRIRVGNVLDYDTLAKPIYTGAVAARRILIALNYVMAQDGAIPADIKVFVTNNGGDASPTWEDATNKFISQDYYEFTNTNKTSPNFAIAFRVVINSNDSMGEIWIDGAGMTFD